MTAHYTAPFLGGFWAAGKGTCWARFVYVYDWKIQQWTTSLSPHKFTRGSASVLHV